jgi:acetyl-CoA carboxylase biotin carboxyl carrier protein
MFPMSSDFAKIVAAMEFAAQHGLRQFTRDDGRSRIALWRDGSHPSAAPTTARHNPGPAYPGAARVAGPTQVLDAEAVTAPLPGLCHLAPDPASPPFVTEGARVDVGQTICIIEAMKVMTAVPAPRAGTVTKIHVASGSAVLTGDRLMDLRA